MFVTALPQETRRNLALLTDAETDPMLQMLVELSWDEVKRFFECEARSLFKTL